MITDSEARNIVINRLDKNIFTNASAGAGKTTSLTSRIVALVESGVDISSICTITFTKAAANEFYERLQALLSKRSNVGIPDRDGYLKVTDEESAKRCKDALQNIDLCFMGTIDSFTNKIVNEHPLENLVPAKTMVVDDKALNSFLGDIYVNIYNGKYDKEYPELIDLRKHFYKDTLKSKDDFVEELKKILDNRNAELVYKKAIPLSTVNNAIIKWFRDDFLVNVSSHPEAITKGSDNIKEIIYLENKLFTNNELNLNPARKFIKLIQGISLNYKKCCEVGIDSILDEYLSTPEGKERNYKYDILDNILKEIDEYIIGTSLEFLEIASKIATPMLCENGLLTYNGFLFTLRDTLRGDIVNGHRIIDHIANKYKYFLLDESQDTSPVQTQVFFYINAQNYDIDYKKCNPRPGSIFIVGDSKQSIYRFKGADVKAYMETEKLYQKIDNISDVEKYDNIAITLTKNFRSSLKLRKWFNGMFKNLLVKEENNPIHEDIDLSDPLKANENKATLNGAYTFETSKNTNSYDVVNIIKEIVNNDKYLILGKKDDTPRKINYKDIMIITKSKNFTDIISTLISEKIPYIAEGKILFEDCEAVKLLKILFKFLVKPSNNQYLFEALKSNYCNLNDNDIISLVNNSLYNIYSYQNNNIINNKANKEMLKLQELVNNTKYLPYSAKYEYLLNNIEIFKYVDTSEIDLAYYVLELLRNAEKDGKLTSENLTIDFIDNIKSSNKNYERSLRLSKENDSVKIANVHKVKGLQAPVVILSWSLYRSKPADHRLAFEPKEEYEPFNVFGLNVDSINKDIEKAELESEKKRLEYVAATRAETVLFISYSKLASGGLAKGAWDELFSSDITSFAKYKEQLSKNEDIEKEEQNDFSNTLTIDIDDLYNIKTCINESSKERTYKLEKPSELKIDRRQVINDDTIKEKVASKDYDFTLYGTTIHRMMELIVNSKNKISLDNIISNIHYEYAIDDRLIETIKKVYDIIQNGGFNQINGTCNNDILKELLNAKSTLCEVPFAYMSEDKLYNGIIDLLYEDKNGNWHIIDYKTNQESDIKKLEEEYASQLEAYKKALFVIKNIKADAHIYHIDIQ